MVIKARGGDGIEVLTRSDGRVVGWAAYGPPDGDPVLFHHGWPSSATQASVIEGAARSLGICLVGVERPGIGLTSPLPGGNLADFSGDIEALVRHLGWDRFRVFGVSGGGPYALLTAARVPGTIAAGVCCGAPASDALRQPGGIFWIYRALIGLVDAWPWAALMALRVIRAGVRTLPPVPMIGLLRHLLPKNDAVSLRDKEIRRRVAEPVRRAFSQRSRDLLYDATRYLAPWGFDPAGIAVPVRFWHGGVDRNLPPKLTEGLADTIPGADFRLYPQEGHYSLPLNRAEALLGELLGLGERD